MESKIKQRVMRRVRIMHTLRPLTSPMALAALVLLVSLYELGRLVFVAQVFRNMPAVEDVSALAQFFVAAFLNTEFIVQICTILTIVALAFIAKDLGRGVSRLRTA